MRRGDKKWRNGCKIYVPAKDIGHWIDHHNICLDEYTIPFSPNVCYFGFTLDPKLR